MEFDGRTHADLMAPLIAVASVNVVGRCVMWQGRDPYFASWLSFKTARERGSLLTTEEYKVATRAKDAVRIVRKVY